MANYPRFSSISLTLQGMAEDVSRWANELTRELDSEDTKQNSAPATKIYSVVSVDNIGRPQNGDVAYSISAEKFRGYVEGTGWIDFH